MAEEKSGGLTEKQRVRRKFLRFFLIVLIGIAIISVFQRDELSYSFRSVEAGHAATLVRLAGQDVRAVGDSALVRVEGAWLYAVVTLSCSSIFPILGFILLMLLLAPKVSWKRKCAGAVTSAAIIYIGNLLRIVFALLVGIHYGRAPMEFFHGWVGIILLIPSVIIAYSVCLMMFRPK